MMKRRLFLFVTAVCSILILINCNGQLAGGGTETTNGISGNVSCSFIIPINSKGIIAAIYSTDYRPDSAIGIAETTIIAEDGGFKFTPPDDNRYNLFFWDTANYMTAYIAQLSPDTNVGAIHLDRAGVLKTTKLSPAVGESPYKQYKIMIPGSPYYFNEESDNMSMLKLPQGEFRIELGLLPKNSSGNNPIWVNQQTRVTINPASKDTTWLGIP
jgi:hypothetical protein